MLCKWRSPLCNHARAQGKLEATQAEKATCYPAFVLLVTVGLIGTATVAACAHSGEGHKVSYMLPRQEELRSILPLCSWSLLV